jgi:pSer/pThr/pTyr-binding forkhead associated (FHA) protein
MYLYRIKPDGSAFGRWQLGDAPLIVGRDEGVAVWIPDYRMSGRHFAIVREGDTFVLHDLNSKNGTWVNGTRITGLELKPNDRITAGRTEFFFEAEETRRREEQEAGTNQLVA